MYLDWWLLCVFFLNILILVTEIKESAEDMWLQQEQSYHCWQPENQYSGGGSYPDR